MISKSVAQKEDRAGGAELYAVGQVKQQGGGCFVFFNTGGGLRKIIETRPQRDPTVWQK